MGGKNKRTTGKLVDQLSWNTQCRSRNNKRFSASARWKARSNLLKWTCPPHMHYSTCEPTLIHGGGGREEKHVCHQELYNYTSHRHWVGISNVISPSGYIFWLFFLRFGWEDAKQCNCCFLPSYSYKWKIPGLLSVWLYVLRFALEPNKAI